MDRYTKCVLTVIAAALCWIGVELSTGNARAAQATHGAIGEVGGFHKLQGTGDLARQPAQLVFCVK